ncbi:LacI family DNA-binding transcriptional regulator [Kordiimonas sp. SCSIO 12603]|uniref:LacI family DNA-binding transcriptional regulator n=1 Tax=Kordiimonas sp. SCSIO 12603 TaxID=2829596 RepID=UPI002105A992|nr:LacI family DNA-binding transcriptional regulator [Kordiimonas sp. SCSIO 12603]UTW58750.1 LacI family DNA-binding transcriptional regulator [Kordiimonas sp. SCSIO 12603]
MVTITDVAGQAGVSVKTVSRVMNNYEHISVKTRQKVEAAMRELGYAPKSMARALNMSSSAGIGILYGDPSSGYQARLNHALLKQCVGAERFLSVEYFDEKNPDWIGQAEAFLDRTKVDDLILVPPMCDSSELHDLFRSRQVNFVLLSPSSSIAGASAITIDDRLASRQLTENLIGFGHQRIAHISGRPDHVATLLRRQGFEEAMLRAGLVVPQTYIEEGRFRFANAAIAANKLLSLPERPTAIFAANDEMAAATIMVANQKGLRVPEDLSVVGFDDSLFAQTTWPALTTVAQPFEAMAKAALDLLRSPIGNVETKSQTLILEHQIIDRDSVAHAPVD